MNCKAGELNSNETKRKQEIFIKAVRTGYPVDRSGLERCQSETLSMFMLIFCPVSAFFCRRIASAMHYFCLFDIFHLPSDWIYQMGPVLLHKNTKEIFSSLCMRTTQTHAPFIYPITTIQLLFFWFSFLWISAWFYSIYSSLRLAGEWLLLR